jgi:hypothetical protein
MAEVPEKMIAADVNVANLFHPKSLGCLEI